MVRSIRPAALTQRLASHDRGKAFRQVVEFSPPPQGRAALIAGLLIALMLCGPVIAQDGSLLTELENEIAAATKGWEASVMEAARALFWILAGIEIGLAAIWLAIAASSIDAWFAELVRRILFVGFFLFVLEQGPDFARAVVDSLFQIAAGSGSASPAKVFDAGLQVAGHMAAKAQFGLFEDNALAVASVFAMIIVVICFSLVAAIFVAVMAEMYVGLLAGMIMLGLGGSSFTKDFAVRYLVYAFSVGLKLMALVMIARIGSEVLIGLAASASGSDEFLATLAIGGIAVVVFVISIYVPNILQGLVQGASVSGGMEAIRHGSQAATAIAGGTALGAGGARVAIATFSDARAAGMSPASAAVKAMTAGVGAPSGALAEALKDKSIGMPGARHASTLGLANAKLDANQRKPSAHSKRGS